MTIRKFSENSTMGNRTHQIYNILVGFAMRHQLIRYGGKDNITGGKSLCDLMGFDGVGVSMQHRLGCILHWCEQNGLPPLTSIVVNKNGMPEAGFFGTNGEDTARWVEDQNAVFNFDWYDIVPPTAKELEQASERAHEYA